MVTVELRIVERVNLRFMMDNLVLSVLNVKQEPDWTQSQTFLVENNQNLKMKNS